MPYSVQHLEYPRTNVKKLTLRNYSDHLLGQVNFEASKHFILIAHSLGGLFIDEVSAILGKRLSGVVHIGVVMARAGEHFFSRKSFSAQQMLRILLRIFGTKQPDKAIKASLCNNLPEDCKKRIVSLFLRRISPHIPRQNGTDAAENACLRLVYK